MWLTDFFASMPDWKWHQVQANRRCFHCRFECFAPVDETLSCWHILCFKEELWVCLVCQLDMLEASISLVCLDDDLINFLQNQRHLYWLVESALIDIPLPIYWLFQWRSWPVIMRAKLQNCPRRHLMLVPLGHLDHACLGVAQSVDISRNLITIRWLERKTITLRILLQQLLPCLRYNGRWFIVVDGLAVGQERQLVKWV